MLINYDLHKSYREMLTAIREWQTTEKNISAPDKRETRKFVNMILAARGFNVATNATFSAMIAMVAASLVLMLSSDASAIADTQLQLARAIWATGALCVGTTIARCHFDKKLFYKADSFLEMVHKYTLRQEMNIR